MWCPAERDANLEVIAWCASPKLVNRVPLVVTDLGGLTRAGKGIAGAELEP